MKLEWKPITIKPQHGQRIIAFSDIDPAMAVCGTFRATHNEHGEKVCRVDSYSELTNQVETYSWGSFHVWTETPAI